MSFFFSKILDKRNTPIFRLIDITNNKIQMKNSSKIYSAFYGYLQVKLLNDWAYVFSSKFFHSENFLVCKHFGYKSGRLMTSKEPPVGDSFLTLNCKKNITSLTQCRIVLKKYIKKNRKL